MAYVRIQTIFLSFSIIREPNGAALRAQPRYSLSSSWNVLVHLEEENMTYKQRRRHPCDFRMPFVIATLHRRGVTASTLNPTTNLQYLLKRCT